MYTAQPEILLSTIEDNEDIHYDRHIVLVVSSLRSLY